ncbi:MAG: hypothetical protein ACYDDO_14575 [Acidiferrobacterales bacterium]
MQDLGTLGGAESAAFGINASGQIVGTSYTSGDVYLHAFLWNGVTMQDLGALDGFQSEAFSINDSGEVVGGSTDPANVFVYHAVLWNGGTIQDLGTLGGSGSGSIATGINASGQVVGISGPTGSDFVYHLFLYYGGAMRDLTALPEVVAAGWQQFFDRPAINDSGEIVGAGLNSANQFDAFLLHPQSTSRYMSTTDPTTLFNLGCAQTNQVGVMILDFGQPWYNGTEYGTLFPVTLSFASIPAIETAVKYFLNGYYVCGGTGHLTVGIGTNNYGTGTTYAHGQAWGQMMTQLDAYVAGIPTFSNHVSVVGASDIELAWNSPTVSRAWVDGYSSTSSVSYYNYGDAQGCPPAGTSCTNGWTQQDVWYVSWGNPANPLPVPEIYFNAPPKSSSNALQWATLATLNGTPQLIAGALTEWQACRDPGHKCKKKTLKAANTPLQAFQETMNALYGVISNPNNVQNVLYSSDITYQN